MFEKIKKNSLVKEIRIVEDIDEELPQVKRKTNSKSVQINKTKGILEISKSKMSEICKYNKNMARKHPVINRSKQAQEQRDKNTTACRVTRRAKKVQELIIEEEYKESLRMHDEAIDEILRSIHYIQLLTI